jgi:hypothetical protein
MRVSGPLVVDRLLDRALRLLQVRQRPPWAPSRERVFDFGFGIDDGLLSVVDQLYRRIAATASLASNPAPTPQV